MTTEQCLADRGADEFAEVRAVWREDEMRFLADLQRLRREGGREAVNIPPKHSKVFLVESTASDPHLCGPLDVILSADGVSIRWSGETKWQQIAWYEIAILAEAPGRYREVIDAWKEQAFEEGLEDGVRTTLKETDVLNYADELKEVREREKLKEQYTPATWTPRGAG